MCGRRSSAAGSTRTSSSDLARTVSRIGFKEFLVCVAACLCLAVPFVVSLRTLLSLSFLAIDRERQRGARAAVSFPRELRLLALARSSVPRPAYRLRSLPNSSRRSLPSTTSLRARSRSRSMPSRPARAKTSLSATTPRGRGCRRTHRARADPSAGRTRGGRSDCRASRRGCGCESTGSAAGRRAYTKERGAPVRGICREVREEREEGEERKEIKARKERGEGGEEGEGGRRGRRGTRGARGSGSTRAREPGCDERERGRRTEVKKGPWDDDDFFFERLLEEDQAVVERLGQLG